jgi:chromosome segregation ATPase
LDLQKQHHQQLEQQVSSFQQFEVAFRSSAAQLEKERDELQAAVREHAAQSQKSELQAKHLHDQLSSTMDKLLRANDAAMREHRLRLEQEQSFYKYRADAMANLADLKEQLRQRSNQIHTKRQECNALQQDVADLKIKLESTQAESDQLAVKVLQSQSKIQILSQERNNAIEKRGIADSLFQSAEGEKLKFEVEKEELSSTLEKVHTSLRESRGIEARLAAQCSDLQGQLNELQNAKHASDEQLQQAQYDVETRLQQVKSNYDTELDDLRSRLNLSESARKESQAKLRQMEAVHKQQFEHHKEVAKAKFDNLASKSQQGRETLEAQRLQKLERCEQEANIRPAQMEQELRGIMEAEAATSRTLVSNTQQSIEQGGHAISSQQSQTERTCKKVDRQIDSMMLVAVPSNQRSNMDERGSTADGLRLPVSGRESSEHRSGYFEEGYQKGFRSRVSLHEQEAHFKLVDPHAEVVLETQDFEYAQGSATQFGVIKSQVSMNGNINQEEVLSDLSTMPSEDLSEMLLDVRSNPERERNSSKRLSSPKDMMHTPGRSAHDLTSDTPSTQSHCRPRSRANTASRMMPLPASDVQRQRVQADDGNQHLVYTCSDRIFGAERHASPEFMHGNDAAPKRTCGHRTSVPGDARADGIDPGRKRSTPSSLAEQDGPFKKLRKSAQSYAQLPSSISKSYSSYTPAPTAATSRPDVDPSPSSATGRRSSNRQLSLAGSQAGTPRLSSTRNTRSKSMFLSLIRFNVCTDVATGSRYADRFGRELDRR